MLQPHAEWLPGAERKRPRPWTSEFGPVSRATLLRKHYNSRIMRLRAKNGKIIPCFALLGLRVPCTMRKLLALLVRVAGPNNLDLQPLLAQYTRTSWR
jgi:hypothetical protein